MRRSSLDACGSEVSVLGLGGNIFGRYCSATDTARLVARALSAGVNLVDTSDTYSAGESETFIGRAIRGRRESWVIATKVGLDEKESPRGLGRPEKIRRKLEGSLRRLQTDYVDLYQMHHYDPETPIQETFGALTALVREGRIRAFGVSNYTLGQLQDCAEKIESGGLARVCTLQAHYNLLRRDLEEALPYCRKQAIGILAYGALGRGILAGRYRSSEAMPAGSRGAESARIRANLLPEVLDVVTRLGALARDRGLALAHLALAWVLSRPGVSSVIVGVHGDAQLEEDLRAADVRLSPGDLDEIDAIVGDWTRYRHVPLGSQMDVINHMITTLNT